MKLLKNSVLAAACIVLALVPVAASTQSNVRVHVRSYAQKQVEDSYDSTDSVDSADSYDSADSTDSTDSYESNDSVESYDSEEEYYKRFAKIDCPGGSPMSVEGVEGVFCVTGQACVADISNGACPGPQTGLPNGASCGVVVTGVYGCKPNSGSAPAPAETPCPSTAAPTSAPAETPCPSTAAPTSAPAATPCPSSAAPTSAPVVTPCPSSGAPASAAPASTSCNGPNQSPMSVEGVEGVFCVTGQACVADIANGACPGPQSGLQYGASCGVVKTGVYGCKPNTAPPASAAPAATTCNGPNQSPMSVEGVEGVFCVTGQACVADISNGACPGPQSGLEHGASCGVVKTGVYGCKPNSSRKHRHHHRRHHH